VPVELGGAGVGGALNMITHLGRGDHGELVTASAGAGSFGARHARVHYGDAYGEWLSSLTFGYAGASGDYRYYDDHQTPLNTKDDTTETRRNNGYDQLDASARIGKAHDAGGVRVAYKKQGLPGSIAQPALDASLSTLDVIGDVHAEHHVGPAHERELAYVLVERQRLLDPEGELGLGSQERRYLTLSAGATSTWHYDAATAGVELRGDRFSDDDTTGMQRTVTGDRAGGAVLAQYDWLPTPALVVTAGARLDALRTAPTPQTAGVMTLASVPPRWDVVPSPRVTARFTVSPELALKASGGWYVRMPTLLELFGDRGYILGSPNLQPERGPSGELGGVWSPAGARGAIDRILVEADVFASRPRDTIAFITSAGFVARAENIGQSQAYGAELVASARIARALTLTATVTELATEQISDDKNFNGKALPREPEQFAYARADYARSRAGAWLDASYQAESFLDNANLGRVPARLLAGAGVRVEIAERVAASLAVENLFDTRIVDSYASTPTALADVAGYPLPGRTTYVTIDWSYR